MQAQERASSGAWLCGGDGTRIKPWGIWELFDHADATGHAMHTEDAQLCATKRDSRDDGGTSAHVRDAPKLTSQGEPSTQPRALARKRDPHHRTKARDGLPGLGTTRARCCMRTTTPAYFWSRAEPVYHAIFMIRGASAEPAGAGGMRD